MCLVRHMRGTASELGLRVRHNWHKYMTFQGKLLRLTNLIEVLIEQLLFGRQLSELELFWKP